MHLSHVQLHLNLLTPSFKKFPLILTVCKTLLAILGGCFSLFLAIGCVCAVGGFGNFDDFVGLEGWDVQFFYLGLCGSRAMRSVIYLRRGATGQKQYTTVHNLLELDLYQQWKMGQS